MFLVLSDTALRWDDQVDADLARTWWLHPGLPTFHGRGHVAMAAPHDEARGVLQIMERYLLYSVPR